MIDLSGLNPSQRSAASSIEGPVLILAGAGSGKTRTITYRIGHMLENMHIPAEQVLAVSFTNKAAREMAERVRDLVHYRFRRGLTLCTFHSLAIRILRNEIHHLGYKNDFTIYDTSDQLSIIRDALKHFKTEKQDFDKKIILSKIGFLKNKGIGPMEFPHTAHYDPAAPYDVATEYAYHFYQDKLHFFNAVDFDDILFLTVDLFKRFPEVTKTYSEKYRYIMIDEYQDTNGLQFSIVQGLTSTHHNICVVGDDDQSIYAFRGADITNILNFEKLYPNTRVIKLEENYRSTNHILNLANTVIKQNKTRKDKTMWSKNNTGEKPLLWATQDTDHEAAIIADDIVKHQSEGTHLGNIAVLYRSNTQVPPLEDQLRLAQVPYNIIGGQKFYEKKEIKDLIGYMSIIYNPMDELSLRRILNVPHRGIGTTSLKNFLEISEKTRSPLFNVLKDYCHHHDDKKGDSLKHFVEMIEGLREVFRREELHLAITKMIEKIDYLAFVDKEYDNPKQAERKKADIANLVQSAERFEHIFKQEANLANFLEKMLLLDNQDGDRNKSPDEKPNEVTLMTLHSSKGLEFDYVYLMGMEEETLPHKRSISEGDDLSEECRLAYVGITRAKKQLVMTYCKERKMYNKLVPRFKSRFIAELSGSHITEQDRTTFGHLTQDEAEQYKSDFFNNLLASLD